MNVRHKILSAYGIMIIFQVRDGLNNSCSDGINADG